ncbi:uncharacterized protein FPRO_13292 [Fusarium proliferatum ET1]|uniref:Secreted protein n=1 Tax=Fusarium proliferatum (strain ET1) TaxID=1227346 RepID=A0A1L7W4T4_FUSPR|nr:uncharacterized protein FPRO_13292 [Fusarium proliferatum ET1]CZR47625.1 uncharacterized protein FPRO_13292 [Fusarium proliferatum ET1]
MTGCLCLGLRSCLVLSCSVLVLVPVPVPVQVLLVLSLARGSAWGWKGKRRSSTTVTHGLLKWQLSQRYPVPELAGRGKPFRALYGCTPYLPHDLAVRLVDLTVGLGGILNTGPPLRTRLDSRPAPLTASPGKYPGQGPSPLNKYQAWLPLLQPVNQPNHCVIRPSHAGLESSHWVVSIPF